ncbi:DUF3828 domain-containing protein [Dyella silvae]|uniref:DUF3828 domain-containing protein n=1 Tax=Dyella silvae TaxID=2994424 RepID=UPI002264C485|nr:DUF3828 domain-containing protein [Dyella silvae]
MKIRHTKSHPLKAFLVVAMLLAVIIIGRSASAQTSSPEAFVRGVYAHYKAGGTPISLISPDAGKVATTNLLEAIKRDAEAMHGEAGVLDADPLCECQDFDLSLENIHISMQDQKNALATVSFINLGSRRTLRLKLVKTKSGWRIDDVLSPDMPSLREAMKQETNVFSR